MKLGIHPGTYTKKGPGRKHKQGIGKDRNKYIKKHYGHFSKNDRVAY